jgi:hypothetical protein
MTHLPRRLAALALGLSMISPLSACGTDSSVPADAGSSADDSGANTGQDTSGANGDSGVTNPDSGATDSGTTTNDAGATNDTGSPSDDAGGATDSGSSDDAGSTSDAGDPADSGATTDAGSADDAGQTMDAAVDMGAADTGVTPDMGGGVDYSNRPAGSCVTSSDCGGGGLFCEREAAGGTCTGCGDCSGIPGPNTHTCTVGACVPDCSTDDDCPPGRTCNRGGLCTVERCTNDVCPVPWFVCSAPDGICQRATCANNEPCPAQTTCTNGVCVEDHSLP